MNTDKLITNGQHLELRVAFEMATEATDNDLTPNMFGLQHQL